MVASSLVHPWMVLAQEIFVARLRFAWIMGKGNQKRLKEEPASSGDATEEAHLQWPVGDLAKDWEGNSVLRARGREFKSITRWPSAKQQCIASMHALQLNGDALFHLAKRWCAMVSVPKSPPIPLIRAEVHKSIQHVCDIS